MNSCPVPERSVRMPGSIRGWGDFYKMYNEGLTLRFFIQGLNEADTRAKLIDPAIHKRGWTEKLIQREETACAVEIINGNPCFCSHDLIELGESEGIETT